MKPTVLFFVACCIAIANTCPSAAAGGGPGRDTVRLILDTDISPDYDDVGAMAVMHALADSGRVDILATVACNADPLVVPCMEVLNTYFRRPAIPVAVTKNPRACKMPCEHGVKWTEQITDAYPHATANSADAPDAVDTYRRLLSAQPDGSVTICTVGFLTNMADLLNSSPDRHSKLNGVELVKRKVRRLVSMGFHFPQGREYNIYCDVQSAKTVVDKWPTEIMFSGFEIGDKILTGTRLVAAPVAGSPVRDAYHIAFSQTGARSRMSWDQATVLAAVLGPEPCFAVERGTVAITDEDGSNTWTPDSGGKHLRLIMKMPPVRIADIIEGYMMHVPRR